MRYRFVETLIGREALVAARIERSLLWYRVTVLHVTGTPGARGELDGFPAAFMYTFTRREADHLARRILGKTG